MICQLQKVPSAPGWQNHHQSFTDSRGLSIIGRNKPFRAPPPTVSTAAKQVHHLWHTHTYKRYKYVTLWSHSCCTSGRRRMNRQVPSVGAVEGTVVAEEFIRAECHSQVVHLDHRRLSQLHPTHFKVVTRKNEIVSSPLTSAWPLSMEVATECRMQNVECTLVSGGTNGSTTATGSSLSLLFSTTRPVEKGQRLHFWFSETMLAQLEMPFLVPRNIQGNQSPLRSPLSKF